MTLGKILIFSLLLLAECFSTSESKMEYRFPKNYSLDQVKTINLPGRMREISGLEWVGENELWAIEDESSAIYKLDPKTGEVLDRRRFAKNHDIEDLVVIDGVAWILESNGKLYEVQEPFAEEPDKIEHAFPIKENRDFEALVHWGDQDEIWVFCKDCSWDEGSKKTSYYPFSIQKQSYQIDQAREMKRKHIRALPELDEEKKYQMQPSAAAKHPLKDEIYVISSSGQWLAIFDLEFKLKDAFELDRKLFKQPEGLTFDPKGNLYISNEARGGFANILVFEYRP